MTKAKVRTDMAQKTISAYKKLFATPEGQIVLRDLMNTTRFRGSVIGKDPYETYYNEGSRNVVMRIIETINMSDANLEKMLEEMRKTDEDLYLR